MNEKLSFEEFRKQCIATDKPKLKDLYKHVTPCYAAHWEDIGVYLDIELGQLETIKADHPGDASGCCKDLWKKWLILDHDATWKKLFNAIDSALPYTGHGGNFFTSLADYLRDNYINTRYIPDGKEWPPNQPKYYVNLAVIHYQGSQTQEEVIFGAHHNEHTNLATDDEVLFSSITENQSRVSNKSKITREIVDLFRKDLDINDSSKEGDASTFTNLSKSILIEGAPGIGKTILLKEVAYRWANGTILDNTIIVFLIYLRDSRFQLVSTINELIRYFDCLDESEIPMVVRQLKKSNGEGVVFLFDGLDEYPDALQNGFLSRLIDRKILSKCVFVITSRPCASLTLHNKVERRIEILGFGNEERDEHISKSLKSLPEKKRKT